VKLQLCVFMLVLGVMGAAASAQQSAAASSPVTAELVASVEAVKAGEPFMVAVRFNIQPKWHIYWKHGGQAGIPTEVKFELPEGFTVGEVAYPVPIKFVQPGDIIGYGYENEALLMAYVTPPEELSIREVPIKARAKWLVCAETCIPGRQDLSMTLPVTDESRPANAALFAEWTARVPAVIDGYGQLITNVKTEVRQDGRDAVNTTTFSAFATLSDVDFYPAGDPGLRIEDIKVEQTGEKEFRVTYTISPLAGFKQWARELEALVVYTGPAGRHGTMITFPTPEPPAEKQN